MPTKPTLKTLSAQPYEIINAIRTGASASYQSLMPEANPSIESVREIGGILTTNSDLSNEFYSALLNRIAKVLVTSRAWRSPWERFKKGYIELGEVVEEVFINLAKPHKYNPTLAETNIFKSEIADVRSAFHRLNYRVFYKNTVGISELKTAFLSWDGVNTFINNIVDAMVTSAQYDEYQVMKYSIARLILEGKIKPINIPAVNTNNIEEITINIKDTSQLFTILSKDYNYSGVYNSVPFENQFIIVTSLFNAQLDVILKQAAFNLPYVEFLAQRAIVDGFDKLDDARLSEIVEDYTPIGAADLALLAAVPAVQVDENFFMIFDNLNEFTTDYNGESMRWQYWYHQFKTVSFSPFANAVVFTTATPAVTAVTVTPAAVTASKGQIVQLSAAVTTTGFAPQSVTWSSSSANTTVESGVVTIGSAETGATVTITATSTFDDTKKATATITVAGNG